MNSVLRGGAAKRDGRLKMNDQLLNGNEAIERGGHGYAEKNAADRRNESFGQDHPDGDVTHWTMATLVAGFAKASSTNLPAVSSEMVWNYALKLMKATENPDQVNILQTVATSKPAPMYQLSVVVDRSRSCRPSAAIALRMAIAGLRLRSSAGSIGRVRRTRAVRWFAFFGDRWPRI